MRKLLWALFLTAGCTVLAFSAARAGEGKAIKVTETDDAILIDTDALQARINKKGYVSGIARESFLDKKTGARDPGFGLHIMDFLLAPGWRDDGYGRGGVHGNLPKHYVEGPQICTKARKLDSEVIRGDGFLAVRLHFTYTDPGKGYKAGSTWEQTMLFQPGLRYMLSAEKITSVNDVDGLFYRIDMPGHVRHADGDSFTQVYLSYFKEPIPASAFTKDFAPDEKFLYQRKEQNVPRHMIRGYQLKVNGRPGPWLAGLTLDPAETSEAWCHQRGYVCFIQELHRKKVKAGESFGAAYAVGYFDDIAEMERLCERYAGKKAIVFSGRKFHLE